MEEDPVMVVISPRGGRELENEICNMKQLCKKKVIGNPSSKGSQPGSYPVTVVRVYLWYDFEF